MLEYHVNYPLKDHDIIEVVGSGYLTQLGRIRIKDMHNGSDDNIVWIEGVHLTEREALRWLVNGGAFDDDYLIFF